jgi:hypothetical protein
LCGILVLYLIGENYGFLAYVSWMGFLCLWRFILFFKCLLKMNLCAQSFFFFFTRAVVSSRYWKYNLITERSGQVCDSSIASNGKVLVKFMRKLQCWELLLLAINRNHWIDLVVIQTSSMRFFFYYLFLSWSLRLTTISASLQRKVWHHLKLVLSFVILMVLLKWRLLLATRFWGYWRPMVHILFMYFLLQ